MKRLITIATVLFISIFLKTALLAQIMGDLPTFQGHLTDALGNPVPDGYIEIRFSIHDGLIGPNELWSELATVQVKDGMATAYLGQNTPLNPDLFTSGDSYRRYLEIKVAEDPPMSPRLLIGGTPASMATSRVVGDILTAPGMLEIQDGTSLVVIAAADGARMTAEAGTVNWGVYVEETSSRVIESMFLDDGTPLMEEEGTASGGNLRLYDNLGNLVIELHPDGLMEARKGSFGSSNTNNGTTAFVVGTSNSANGNFSSVLGGQSNSASGGSASVVGGLGNTASFGTTFVGGGQDNTASGTSSLVGGGLENTASGQYATVPGGRSNTASGDYSFAAGRGAQATHPGSFVWSDAAGAYFNSAFDNQFSVRASGGTVIYSNSNLSSGVRLPAGTSQWQIVSDRNAKRDIRPVEGAEIIGKIAQLPISRWSYKTEAPGIEHIGPMAQDFYRLFGLGGDDKHISELDPAGVALAGVQELIKQVEELKKENAEIKAELARINNNAH